MNFKSILGNYFPTKPEIINKLAFFINEEYLFDHYTNLLSELEINSCEIILADKFRQYKHKDLVDKIKSYGWNVVFLKDVLYKNKYKILLTHMYHVGNTILAETLVIKFKLTFISLLKKIGMNFFKLND